MKQTYYFNITGTDGSGKDSVVKEVLSRLDYENFVIFREPGGNEKAEILRKIILTVDEEERKKSFKMALEKIEDKKIQNYINKALIYFKKNNFAMMETYLFAASRGITNKEIVEKGLKKGKNVFGSRSISCSMAYQGKARGLGIQKVWEINKPLLTKLPDFEIFLDVPVKVTLERLKKRKEKQDRLDLESEEFHRLTKQGYLEFYKNSPFPVFFVDATGTIKENAEKVIDILRRFYIA